MDRDFVGYETLRVSVPEVDKVIGKEFSVLDDGFVRVVDYMGGDTSIVQAARVSYGAGTKKLREDAGLIRYLMRHQHTTPFEMCEIKLHVRAPMDCWRQWIRHRTANVNEYSTRYSIAIDAAQTTSPHHWRLQSTANKQGSEDYIDNEVGSQLSASERELHKLGRRIYEERIQLGVAKEQARKDLPLSTYTEAYWKIDLHNLLHFLILRMDDFAQSEIRNYASVIGNEIVGRWCPLAWSAFKDYRLNARKFSRLELQVIGALLQASPKSAINLAIEFGWLDQNGCVSAQNREREELETKLASLGIQAPWKEKK